jgi:hypothetical protein
MVLTLAAKVSYYETFEILGLVYLQAFALLLAVRLD